MNTLLRVALIAAISVAPCLGQNGTVIFYTPGESVKSVTAGLLLPKSHQPFTGWLFDGPHQLAHVRPGRFMIFHLNPGAHSFTVPWHSNRPGKEPLVISLEAGGQHCIRVYAKMTNYEVIPFEWHTSHIEEVPCQQAQGEAANLKPIELRRVHPAARAELDPATVFPAESQSQHQPR